jgi:hypothetical protein
MLELEADHRQHAVVENVIRDSKYGLGLNHAQRQVRRQRGLAGAQRGRAEPLPLDGTLGRLRDRLPESLAAPIPLSSCATGRARATPAAATAGGMAVARKVPDIDGQALHDRRAVVDLNALALG